MGHPIHFGMVSSKAVQLVNTRSVTRSLAHENLKDEWERTKYNLFLQAFLSSLLMREANNIQRADVPFSIPSSLRLLPLSWVRNLTVRTVHLFSSNTSPVHTYTEGTDRNIPPQKFSFRCFADILKDVPSLNEHFYS